MAEDRGSKLQSQQQALEVGVVKGFRSLGEEKQEKGNVETVREGVKQLLAALIADENGALVAGALVILVKHLKGEQNDPQDRFLATRRLEEFLDGVTGEKDAGAEIIESLVERE